MKCWKRIYAWTVTYTLPLITCCNPSLGNTNNCHEAPAQTIQILVIYYQTVRGGQIETAYPTAMGPMRDGGPAVVFVNQHRTPLLQNTTTSAQRRAGKPARGSCDNIWEGIGCPRIEGCDGLHLQGAYILFFAIEAPPLYEHSLWIKTLCEHYCANHPKRLQTNTNGLQPMAVNYNSQHAPAACTVWFKQEKIALVQWSQGYIM